MNENWFLGRMEEGRQEERQGAEQPREVGEGQSGGPKSACGPRNLQGEQRAQGRAHHRPARALCQG